MSRIHSFDLNLIRVFDALLAEGSVTKAGERLGLTQSAVSHALKKLRETFDDELFVRSSDGMTATPKALSLASTFHSVLHQISEATADNSFDPSTSDTTFVLAVSDYTAGTLLPLLFERLNAVGPSMRILVRPLSDLNLVEELDRGTVHVALGGFEDVPSRFVQEPVMDVRSLWAMRANHPAAKSKLTLEILAEYPHIDVSLYSHNGSLATGMFAQSGLQRVNITSNPLYLEGLLAERGLSRRVSATLPHFLSIPRILSTTDMIAFLPLALVQQTADLYGIIGKEPPYAFPVSKLSMLSHRTMGGHPSVSWLRMTIQSVATTINDG
jgi:DNA-binding transcriptional LysR family regulator